MSNLTSSLLAGGLSLLMGMTSFVPAQAVMMPSISISAQSDVQQVRDIRIMGGHHGHRGSNRNYHNHGYRYRNDSHHNRTGAIIGGLAAGAIIGGVLGAAGSHQSCASRYQSYRASDNTYQPYNGPRRQCQ